MAGCGGDCGTDNGASGGCRCSKTCKQTTVGTQRWMAENLNITVGDSWCYGRAGSYGDCDSDNEYGRLYTWDAAMRVCPAGWRLPDTADWRRLVDSTGGYDSAGAKLKSKSGWYGNGNGTDDYGFTGLPGGYLGPGGVFDQAGSSGYWWTATSVDDGFAYSLSMYHHTDGVAVGSAYKEYAFSVRCVAE